MISAALITPGGDPVSLCILTIPLYFLFEVSILVGTLIEKRNTDSSSSPSSLLGSLVLLSCLLMLCGSGGWLYLNWDKAEALFLGLEPKAKTINQFIPNKSGNIESANVTNDMFILELTPVKPDENNGSKSSPKQVFQAKILTTEDN